MKEEMEKNSSESEELKITHRYQRFDYFYSRTCFRLMGDFFKQLFHSRYNRWFKKSKQTALNDVFYEFVGQYFSEQMDRSEKTPFLCAILSLVFSNRHKKCGNMPSGVDFELVRGPMYKYSKQNADKFLGNEYLAFFAKWFMTSETGKSFLKERLEPKGKAYYERVLAEMAKFEEIATKTLAMSGLGQVLMASLQN